MSEAWTGYIENTGGFLLPWAIRINRGFLQYGPDGGPFLAWTEKGAKRKLARELRRVRARDAKKALYCPISPEVLAPDSDQDDYDREDKHVSMMFDRTVNLLEKLGINHDRILIDDFTFDGYYEFVPDEAGNHQLDKDGNLMAVRREWPDRAVALQVIEQFVKDKLGQP